MTTIQLTDEQRVLIEASGGQPVTIVDAQTQRAYVLLPAELYEKVRGIVEREAARSQQRAPSPPVQPGESKPMRVRLRDLPLPPEILDDARRRWQKRGMWDKKNAQAVADELRFQYHYGGQVVVYLPSAEGPIIVAAGREDSEEFIRRFQALTPEERRQKITHYPPLRNDEVSHL
jgi:hypothetical protein